MLFSATFIVSLFTVLSSAVRAEGGLAVIDFTTPKTFPVIWTRPSGTLYNVLDSGFFNIRIAEVPPGAVLPATKRRSARVTLNLNDCVFENKPDVYRAKRWSIQPYNSDTINYGSKLTSANACRMLSIVSLSSPEVTDEIIAPGIVSRSAEPSRPLGNKPTAVGLDFISAAESLPEPKNNRFIINNVFSKNIFSGDALKVTGPTGWKGPASEAMIWLALKGELKITAEGKTSSLKPNMLVHIPKGYAGVIQMEPVKGHFIGAVVTIKNP